MKLKQLFAIGCLGLTLQVQAAPFIRLGELNVKLCQHGRKSRSPMADCRNLCQPCWLRTTSSQPGL